jgi:hypothetical protein
MTLIWFIVWLIADNVSVDTQATAVDVALG